MSSTPVYERIIFNRESKTVKGFTFEKESENVYIEHYVYKQDDGDNGKTRYSMFLYKNPGLKKMLRFKMHSWGVQQLEKIIEKNQLKAKISHGKELFKEKSEKIREKTMEQKEKLKEKINDLTSLSSFK